MNPPDTWAEYRVWGEGKAVGFVGRSLSFGLKMVGWAAVVGEWFADTLGITDSAYQNVVDAQERDQRRREREARMNPPPPEQGEVDGPAPEHAPVPATLSQSAIEQPQPIKEEMV